MDQDRELIGKPKYFLKYFSNPWVGLITAIATFISVVLAIVFFRASRASRNLKFYCHPVKAQIYKSDQASRLEVFYENQQIQKDIIAVQVAIWNDGKMPIKKDEILEGIVIYTKPECSIIDAAVRKRSRDIIGLTIENNYFKEGRIPISWKILERNDGAIIQIIFAGDLKTEILIKGAIEGQKTIGSVKYPLKIKSPQEQIRETQTQFITMVVAFISLLALYFFMTIFSSRRLKRTKRGQVLYLRILNLIAVGILVFLAILLLYTWFKYIRTVTPPFGFE